MNISLTFIRVFFMMLCVLSLAIYSTTSLAGGFNLTNMLIGLASGLAIGALLISTDSLLKRFNLRAFNVAALGLFFGYLMGEAIMAVLDAALNVQHFPITSEAMHVVRIGIFLFTAYIGMTMTTRAAEELHVSIPFIKFKPTSHKKKDILIDSSILTDSRIIDLASSGLLDHHLVLPRFILKELHTVAESGDESAKYKARRSLDVFKKLENIASLDLRYADTDFPEIKDPMSKLIRLARLMDANIITADINRVQQSSIEGVRIINIHILSNALKPLTQTGEYINIKIQRYGKEPRQGVGYLDDGTMVVVNGGADSIGDVVKAQVLSVKHTSSGRMIFCNSTDENLLSDDESAQTVAELDQAHNSYLTV